MNTRCTHDVHMMCTRYTHDTHDTHMMHTWCARYTRHTHDTHMMHTWCTHDDYPMHTHALVCLSLEDTASSHTRGRNGSALQDRFRKQIKTWRSPAIKHYWGLRQESVCPDLRTRMVSCPGRGGQAPVVSCCPRQQPWQHSLPLTHSPRGQHWFPLQVSPRSGQCGYEPCSEGFLHPERMRKFISH